MTGKATLRTVIRFGPFTLDGSSGELRNGPTRLKVPDQSIAVLQALLEHPGELVTRDALRDRLWGADTFVDFEAGLNAAVRRLREALNDSADKPRYIETLPRRGYRFIAPVEGALAGAVLGSSGSIAPPADRGTALEPLVSMPPENTGMRSAHLWRAALAMLVLAAIGAITWIGLGRRSAAPIVPKPWPITSFPGLELDPALSPSGAFVAFAWEGEPEGSFHIYVRSIDGSASAPLPLTNHAADDHAPAWSPDGQQIAFVRALEGKRQIIVVPALGGVEQPLFEAGPDRPFWTLIGDGYGLSWTPDGNHLVFGDRSGSASAIFIYSFEDGQRRQLTHPPANLGDTYPVVSPDGRYLAFVRGNPFARGGDVFLTKFDPLHVVGDLTQVTSGHAVHAFDWTQDGRSLIYDSPPVEPALWRTALTGGAPQLVLANVRAWRPSVARSRPGVVYQNTFIDSNIWELPIASSPNRPPSSDSAFRVIASTSADADMRLSPDQKRFAFNSLRSGSSELWVSNRDGSQAKQLTRFDAGGRVGSPSWRPDGQLIAFDAIQTSTGNWTIRTVSADGGHVDQLTSDAFDSVQPNWSIDGRWIYFGSNRGGAWQIWRMSPSGGALTQMTQQGGKEPVVSLDGRHVYYAKHAEPGIWRIPVDGGGPEVRVVEMGRELSFDVAEAGIFVMDTLATPLATIDMFSFASGKVVPIARLQAPGGGRFPRGPYLNVSRDGSSIWFMQVDQRMSDIEMLREFR